MDASGTVRSDAPPIARWARRRTQNARARLTMREGADGTRADFTRCRGGGDPMWQRTFVLALAIGSAPLLSIAPAEAQGYMPWPPPPGMTAGEYAERYGHRRDWGAARPQPGWQERAYRERPIGATSTKPARF